MCGLLRNCTSSFTDVLQDQPDPEEINELLDDMSRRTTLLEMKIKAAQGEKMDAKDFDGD